MVVLRLYSCQRCFGGSARLAPTPLPRLRAYFLRAFAPPVAEPPCALPFLFGASRRHVVTSAVQPIAAPVIHLPVTVVYTIAPDGHSRIMDRHDSFAMAEGVGELGAGQD